MGGGHGRRTAPLSAFRANLARPSVSLLTTKEGEDTYSSLQLFHPEEHKRSRAGYPPPPPAPPASPRSTHVVLSEKGELGV